MSAGAPLGPALLATLGLAAYHVAQRSIPPGANPALVFLAMYLTGALACGVLLLTAYPPGIDGQRGPQLTAAVIVAAFAVLAAEFGTLSMYRNGWDIAVGGLVVNVGSSVLLVPVGILCFGERLNGFKVGGVVLALIALTLLSLPDVPTSLTSPDPENRS